MNQKIIIVLAAFLMLPISFFGQSFNQIIDKELQSLISEKKIGKADALWKITSDHVSRTSGTHHIYFRQVLNGLEINGSESSIHISPDGSILTKHLNFTDNIKQKSNGGVSPGISAKQAVASAAAHLGYDLNQRLNIIEQKHGANRETLLSKGGISISNIPVKLMYHKLDEGPIKLVWDLSIEHISKNEWYSLKVDASTGEVLDQLNWTVACDLTHNHDHDDHRNTFSYREQVSGNENALMTGSYRVFAMPIESPYFGSRTLETNVVNTTASPFGWHDTNGVAGPEYTVTRGNNANAYEDGDNPGYQPNGGASLIFDFPFNPVYSSGDQSEAAAITNLFYWSNIIHDMVYMYGFDEASGNFQANNYGNGGLGNDWVRSEAQDGSGTCNANFSTPPDGSLPRMQMYVCGNQDGDFDNLVIVHEYAHGITNRLTGGAAAAGCLGNQEQMGEGWSDWYGLLMTMLPGDTSTDSRAVGTYLFGQGPTGNGIRPYPYNTNMAVNPQTYDHIKTAAVPHGVGSVWSTMLWEMTWNLIDIHGFDTDFYNGTGGNNIALALVTEALKLQPCSPGFVDGRDAILAADVSLYGGANQCAIWDAFAKRGLGVSANQGSSGSRSDGTEAFDTPSGQASFTAPGDLCEAAGVQTNLSGGSPIGGVYSGPGVTDNGNGINYTFDPAAAGVGVHVITYSTPASACAPASSANDSIEVFESLQVTCQSDITVNADAAACSAVVTFTTPSGISGCSADFFENFDGVTAPALPSGWSFTQDSGTLITWVSTSSSSSSAPNAVFANNPGSVNLSSLLSPELQIGSTSSQLIFKNRYQTENSYDGMVLEYTINNGTTWNDILNGGGTFSSGGYNGTLNTCCSNPLPGRQAWTGNSGGFVDTVINLSASLNGETVRFRWRMGSDNTVSSTGVWLDNIQVTGLFSPDPVTTQIEGLASGSVFPIGTTLNVFEIEDAAGNIETCSFEVTVVDNIEPIAVGQDLTVQLDASGLATITTTDIDNGSSDNCAIDTMTLDITEFTCADIGPNTVTLTVTDLAGNSDTVEVTVTVEDTLDPVVQTQNLTIFLNASGLAVISPSDIDDGSSDNCALDTMTLDITEFTCADIGPNTVTLTVTDASGNSDSAQAIVTVEDNLVPVAIGQSITIQLDVNGEATIFPADVDNGSNDNCSSVNLSVNVSDFTCSDIGTNTVVLTVTDGSGNSASTSVTVTVEDTMAPDLNCPADLTVQVATGATYTVPDYFAAGEAFATDNCTDPVSNVVQNPASGTALEEGVYTIEITVTDDFGNASSCDFQLTVEEILGIHDQILNDNSIILYPNPTSGNVIIENRSTIDLISARITDVNGRLIQTVNFESMQSEISLSLKDYASGLYFIQINSENSMIVKRVIKK